MNTIGLLGGMSWESTREYYRIINEQIREAKGGGLHSAPMIIHSFEFDAIAARQRSESWSELNHILSDAAKGLENAGAQAIMICTNYMHKCAPAVESAVSIPLIHIADVAASAALANGQNTVGLLGARGTMQENFYRDRLASHGLKIVIPNDEDCEEVHRVVFDELCQGKFLDASRTRYLHIIQKLADNGAQGIVLGCTEIEQLIRPTDTPLTLYNTAELHALAGAEFVLKGTLQSQAA